jgi:4-methyl-5(b-hydroxyethyl)-thiazole monophosphate biosynthesis
MVKKKVLLFLAKGFEDLEAVAIIDVCGWTKYRKLFGGVSVVTTGFHPEVRGRFGLRIEVDMQVKDINPTEYAALAIPGGFHSHGFREAFHPAVQDLARSIHAAGGTIAAMCVGVMPVAEAGLLRGKRATSYPFSRKNLERLKALGAVPTSGPIEVDDRIISCAGPAQSIQVGQILLESLISKEAADQVRKYMAGAEHLDTQTSELRL